MHFKVLSIVLRGRTQDLSSVVNFIPILKKSEIFEKVRVKYTTERKTPTGEAIDFEIICQIVSK